MTTDKTYFEDLALSEDILDALYDMRFETCTPVQAQCIPLLLQGRDVIGIAQTGTGKTAAYLLPLLSLLQQEPHPSDAINCLIMVPTRELAQQVDEALQGFGYYTGATGLAVYGGNDGIRYEQERRSLRQGADIIIATPGRLLTHIDLGNVDLSRTTHLVLDEADRMLDMGFSDDLLKIIAHMPRERQTILFSATMPDEIRSLARSVMRPDAAEVRIAVAKPAEKIRQSVYVCREADKMRIIEDIFSHTPPQRTIVFCSSKQKVKELNILLKRHKYDCEAMHSDLLQSQRDDVMQRFRAARIDILVATDIVSRGIDIDDIQTVINFDAPRHAEDYVHRIGRTARAGKAGQAITLVGERDQPALRNIEKLLGSPVPRAQLPEGLTAPSESAPRQRGNGRQRGNRDRRRSRGGKNSGSSQPRGGKSGNGRRRPQGQKPDTPAGK